MNLPPLLALTSPFDMNGSDFLNLFWILALVALAGGFMIRRFFTQDYSSTTETEEPSPYEVACLAGPPVRAVHAAVAQLCQDGMISVDANKWQISFVAPGEVTSRPAIEQSVLRAVAANTNVPYALVEAACAPALADLESSLRAKRLLLPADRARLAWLIPCLMIFAVQALGLIRFFVGLSRHKPVLFLVISWLAFGFISSLVLGKRPYRTRRGDQLLSALRVKYAELQRRPATTNEAGTTAPVFASIALPLAVGVLGYSVLAGTPADGMYQRMRNTGSDGGGYGGDGGSSDSGGGDSGGGGCGGCGGGGD
jgi:uncharacterized protein (TIGR04222 family)